MTMTDLKDFIKIGPNYVRHYTDISTPDKSKKANQNGKVYRIWANQYKKGLS